MKKAILITGASTGIGRALVNSLQGKYKIYAGVRSSADGMKLADEVSDLVPLILDVTSESQVQDAAKFVAQAEPDGLHGLINNAGVCVLGPVEATPIAEFERQMQVNLFGAIRMIQAFLPLLRVGRGRIINMSSTSGIVAWPYSSPYVASKFALEGLSDALRLELKGMGIPVVLIQPGSIRTPLWSKLFSDVRTRMQSMTPEMRALYDDSIVKSQKLIEKVVDQAIEPQAVSDVVELALSCAQPRCRYRVGSSAHLQRWLKALLPTRMLDNLKWRALQRG